MISFATLRTAVRPIALVVAMLAWCVSDPAAAATFGGRFALQTGTARAVGRLDVTAVGNDPLLKRLVFTMDPLGSPRPLRRYDVDMTKLLHVIIVSSDFSTFLHVHPVYSADGRFTIVQRFPRRGVYEIYADGEPRCLGQQVFRFAVPVGSSVAAARQLRPTGPSVDVGPYVVTLSGTRLRAGGESTLAVRITRDGRLARDMQTYLGAAAHAVFLDANDLTYVHVHPAPPARAADDDMAMSMTMPPAAECARGMAMPPMQASPTMLLHVAVAEPGRYELWLQFRANGTLHVAPFVVTAHGA